jgi:hypothetical protein
MIEDYINVRELPNGTRLMAPERRISDKLEGFKLRSLFSPEHIKNAEQLLQEMESNFPDELKKVIHQMKLKLSKIKSETLEKEWRNLRDDAFFLRNQAPIFGHKLIGRIGDMMYRHLERRQKKAATKLIARMLHYVDLCSQNKGKGLSEKNKEELLRIAQFIKKDENIKEIA